MGVFTRFFRKHKKNAIARTSPCSAPHAGGAATEFEPVFDFLPAHPEYRAEKNLVEISLPEASAYTLAMIGPLIFPWDDVAGLELAARIFKMLQRCYLLFVYSLTLQVFILIKLWPYAKQTLLEGESPAGCDTVDRLLKFACISIFTIAILDDLHETWLMLDFVRHAPDAEGLIQLRARRADNIIDPAWGLHPLHKLFCIGGVLLPKVAVAVVLWFEGVGFITLSSDNAELIIDMLALGFVTELDEIIFIGGSTRREQEAIATLPTIRQRDLSRGAAAKVAPAPCDTTPRAWAGPAQTTLAASSARQLVTRGAAAGKGMSEAEALFEHRFQRWLYILGLDKLFMIVLVSALAGAAEGYICGW